jgi:hypothetical protein
MKEELASAVDADVQEAETDLELSKVIEQDGGSGNEDVHPRHKGPLVDPYGAGI